MSAPDRPAGPDYRGRSLSQVLPSAAASLGLPGWTNALGLPASRRVAVVMVDGLGSAHLKRFAGHAPFLKSAQSQQASLVLSAAYPTTTAASLSSLGTGLEPGQHGLVGYDVLDPERNVVINQLGGWDRTTAPLAWQPHPTVFEQLAEGDTEAEAVTVSLPKFRGSALTEASLRGSRFVEGGTLHARFQQARQELTTGPAKLVYLYLNELDRAGHRHGTGSPDWLYALEEIDAALRRLSRQVPADTLVLVTGDHGMVDVPESGRIDYSTDPGLIDGVEHTAGEPRLVQLHFAADASARVREGTVARWRAEHGGTSWILTREEAVAAGWFGRVSDQVMPRIGDVLIAPFEQQALFDGRRATESAFEMIGHHGAPTRAEREVPLLTVHAPRG